ncbi:DUF4435 domain-containing protein [uncultured Bradyrhizobium sp.]|jgi:hypothetical protein|uniref:DUF4435 domain-containing protein n=1 Tax=uncultured Bradyrhizobium sp. TaxID=199684 RepID=UPI002617E3EE|nr:DUF4435 domain-containing protein [uncultured Bradyrhizobium sp.]
MSFRRTPSGIANLHLFFRVDSIVFCEGGEPLGVTAALSGGGDESTLDCDFWRRTASFLGAKRTYHFKSIGSKSTLKLIAQDATTHSIATAIVCFDRDFDWHCQRELTQSRVAYTYGYSWENDAISEIALEGVFLRFFPRDARGQEILTSISNEMARFKKDVQPWCESEIALSFRGHKPIFDRNKPLASIDLNATPPRFSHERARQMLIGAGYARRPRRKIMVSNSHTLQHCWGKMVSRFGFHLFTKLVTQVHAEFRLTYDAFMRLMTSETFEAMSKGKLPELEKHFKRYTEIFT